MILLFSWTPNWILFLTVQRWKSSTSEPEIYLEECIKSLVKEETMDGDNKLVKNNWLLLHYYLD